MLPRFEAAGALGLTLRPMADEDMPFVAALYASTRADEFAPLGWPPAALQTFLAQQHDAQHRHFRSAYPDADWLIVERGGEPVGRLYLDENETEVRLIDISLMPACRGAGLGGTLIADLISHADASGKPVALHVAKSNPGARRLYLSLGFHPTGEDGMYETMEREPELPAAQ